MRFGSNARGRARRYGTRGVAVITTMLITGLWAAPVAHAAGPAIKVTPNVGLVSGQNVKVTGTGFFAGEDLIPLECPHGDSDPISCGLDSAGLSDIVTDSHGRFSAMVAVERTIETGTGFADCAPAACDLVIADSSNPSDQAIAPLKFDASVPLPKTTLTVTPNTGLGDRQTLKIRGTGFTADREVDVLQCASSFFSCFGGFVGRANAAGRFSIVGSADRYVTDENGNPIDCAAAAGTCTMVAFDPLNVDYHNSVSLTFDPNKPPPPPSTLTVDPSDNLPYYAHVSLHGTHWGAGDTVLITECPSGSDFPDCFGFVGVAQVGADGTFSTDQILTRKIPDLLGGKATDCAKSQCVVAAQDGIQMTPVSAPITFDPHAPIPPKPTVDLDPGGSYTDRQIVTVNGHSFAPNALFTTTECFSTDDGVFGCFASKQPPQTTDAHGDFSSQVRLHRFIKLEGVGTLDCADPSVTCTLSSTSEGGVDVETPLTFSASAAAPSAAAAPAAWSARRSGWASTLPNPLLGRTRRTPAQWLRFTSKAQGLS